MRINVKEIKRKIDQKYYGDIRLFEETEDLSEVAKILDRGKCSVSMACTLCCILHIPFRKMWEG